MPENESNRANAQTLNDGSKVDPAKPGAQVKLRDRLVIGLKALSKSDLAFIDRVVARVNSGRLPQRMVDETFFWARQRAAIYTTAGKDRRPVIYFRPALTAQAKRIGVTL